jgi:hypothetical protein
MYNINFNKLVAFNVPEFLWRITDLKWMALLVSQVKSLYDEFIAWKDEVFYNAAHSGQVISLEHILNDIFDPSYRRIYIDDGLRGTQNYIFNTSENQDEPYIFNASETANPQLYLFNNQEDTSANYDFKVMVPLTLVINQNRMKGLVNVYKEGSKTYKILTF